MFLIFYKKLKYVIIRERWYFFATSKHVSPFLFLILTSAPFSDNNLTISKRPSMHAKCKAVLWSSFLKLMSILFSIKYFVVSKLENIVDKCKSVLPCLSL